MGEQQNQSFQLSFNPSLKVTFQGRMGIVWTPFRALAPAKKMIMRWNPSMGI